MKNLMKKSVSILLVAVCLMGTVTFADTTNGNQGEVIEMQTCTAKEVIGGIPESIQGPDREDLEVMLSAIDEYNSAGMYDEANELWGYVLELLSHYDEQYNTNTEENEGINDEQLIKEYIEDLEYKIERYESAGYYKEAEELRAELERFLMETFGEQDPQAQEGEDNHFMPEDIQHIIEETEREIERLESQGLFNEADQLRMELEAFLNEIFGQEEPDHMDDEMFIPEDVQMMIEETEREIERLESQGLFNEADQLRMELEAFLNEIFGQEEPDNMDDEMFIPEDVQMMIEETEREIERLESQGLFEEADQLRMELEGFLNEIFGQEDPDHMDDEMFIPEDVQMMIEETEREIERLESQGLFEEADQLRMELEAFLNEIFGNEDPDHMNHEQPFENFDEVLSIDEVLSRINHELTPEQFEILSYLVREINSISFE